MVDLETAARSFKDALDAPGAVESATQLRTLLASIKADLQRLLRRIHPPGPPTVPRAPRVAVAHAVLSEQAPRLSSASDCSSLAPESPRSLRPSSPSPSPPPPSTPPRPPRSRSNSPATASSSSSRTSSSAAASAASAVACTLFRGKRKCGTISQVSRGSDTRWQLQFAGVSLPIESAVAGASCTATIASCEPDVLARYVSCLVECEQLDPNLAARLESLVEDAARLTSGMSLFDQVRTLFGVTNALQNLTNWRVGRILMDAPGRDDVELANFCGEYLTRLLRDLVARCSDQFGCVTCSSHLADPISTTFPCRTVQRTFRLLQHNAVNVNTASLKECSAYPTSVKRIVSRLGDLKAYYSRTLAVPMPSYAMATLPVFALAAGCSAWEAVNYCDGDGGSILVEQFPGLSKYLRQQNVATHILAAPQCTLVQFREAFHDAVELGHQYTVVATREDDEPGPSTRQPTTSVLRRNYGYQALVHARHALATAKVILLVCHGVHRGDGGDRIVVEVVIRDVTSGTFLVSGLSRVQCGFSFPVQNAPRHYVIAKEEAVAAHCGVLEIGPSMAGQEAMPWSLKEAFSSGQSPVAIAGCLITNSTQFLNQSHLHIHTSFIPGAGWGLMIRPCPNATIPRGAYVCHFAIGQPPSTAPPSDYELSSTRRGSLLVYDPQVYDGHNIGRFINQGGLLEGLKELVAASDRDRGCTAYSPTVAEAIFADRSCVEYHVANGGSEMVVRASKPISSHPCRMIELLANYGLPYWLAHVVKYHRHIGHDSDLVKCVFWLLLSDKSTMPIQVRNTFLTPEIDNDVRHHAMPTCEPSKSLEKLSTMPWNLVTGIRWQHGKTMSLSPASHLNRFATELWLPGFGPCSSCIGDCKVWVLVSCLQCSTPAMEAAVAAHCGVLEIGPSMAGQEAMPWSLKEAFSSGQSAVAIAGCLITNSTQFLNHQSHLHIHTSFIPGAGWGLITRPSPNATIPSGEYVCHFANPHQRHHLQTMSCPLSDEAYDPHVYDGHNIGRFINQGELLEGLRELVAASDRDRGCTAYSPTVAEAIFAVVEYHVANGGSEMVVLAAPIGQIHLASTYVLRKTFLTPDR
eukprot:Em0971g1a